MSETLNSCWHDPNFICSIFYDGCHEIFANGCDANTICNRDRSKGKAYLNTFLDLKKEVVSSIFEDLPTESRLRACFHEYPHAWCLSRLKAGQNCVRLDLSIVLTDLNAADPLTNRGMSIILNGYRQNGNNSLPRVYDTALLFPQDEYPKVYSDIAYSTGEVALHTLFSDTNNTGPGKLVALVAFRTAAISISAMR